MKTLSAVVLVVAFLVNHSEAQTSVNPDWYKRHGLSVASAQTVTVTATILRGFTTIEVVDSEPRQAIAKLKVARKSAIDSIKNAIGLSDDAIKTTTARIADWERVGRNGMWQTQDTALTPTDSEEYTATTHLCFDVSLKGVDSDELTVLPHEISSKLKKQAVFESSKFVFTYVGVVSDEQAQQATKKAYHEAMDNAKKLAAMSDKSLGKMVELTATNQNWRYWLNHQTYSDSTTESGKVSPLSRFKPLDNEVFGNNPDNLSRLFSVDLCFEIE